MANLDMKAMFSLTYGMYIVSTEFDGKLNGQVANTCMQITSEPLCVAICINKANLTTELVSSRGAFSVSVLEREVPMTFIGQFGFKSGRDIDKFSGVKYRMSENGLPLIEDWCAAAFDARVVNTVEMPSHVLFTGEVREAHFFRDVPLLTYSDYHSIKKGKSPKTAPTFGFNALK